MSGSISSFFRPLPRQVRVMHHQVRRDRFLNRLNAMALFLIICVVSLGGFAILCNCLRGASPLLQGGLSFVIGLMLWANIMAVTLALGLPDAVLTGATLYGVFTLGLLALAHLRRLIQWSSCSVMVGSTLMFYLITSFNDYAVTIGDPGYIISVGVDLARFGEIPADTTSHLLWAFPLFLSFWQGAVSTFLGLDTFVNIAPPLAVTLMLVFGISIRRALVESGAAQKWAVVFAILTPLVLFSSWHMIIQFFYFNHHVLLGLCILLLAYFRMLNESGSIRIAWPLYLLIFMSMAMMRMEGVGVILATLFFTLEPRAMDPRHFRRLAASFFLLFSMYWIYLIAHGSNEYAFGFSERALFGLFLIGLADAVYISLVPMLSKLGNIYEDRMKYASFASVALLVVLYLTSAPYYDSIQSVFKQMFSGSGLWAGAWFVIAVFTIVVLLNLRQRLLKDFYFSLAMGVFTFYMLLVEVRGAYHPRMNDSLNRNLLIFAALFFLSFYSNMNSISLHTAYDRAKCAVARVWGFCAKLLT